MIRIAICDDDTFFLNYFNRLIVSVFNGASNAIDCYTSPKELMKSSKKYDIIFLDIEMPEINGIELACKYQRNETIIVFVTNRDALVFDAYNTTDTFGFVRKSYLKSDLKNIITRLNNESFTLASIAVKIGKKVIKIKCSEIIYIEKSSNNVIIHTQSGVYSERRTLAELEKLLLQYGFERCHIGYLVNTKYIYLIDNTEILLTNSERIPLSRRNIKRVKSTFIKRSARSSDRYNFINL